MQRFLIKRDISEAGQSSKIELDRAGLSSEEVLMAMRSEGKNIVQQRSYILGNSIICDYLADNEDVIREHGKRCGIPVTQISEVFSVIKHDTS